MQERVQRLEASRLSVEEELSRAKVAALGERSQAEEELIKAKNQQQRLAHLEEKLQLLAQARDEAQSACLQQKQSVADPQARAGQLGLQVEGLRRRLEELQQELSNKDQEKVAEVTRVRVELQEQNGRLQAELTALEAPKEKLAALERQLKVISSDHREALLDRESENASLREKLRLKEAEIARILDEEAQRAVFLQNAVLAYVQGSPLRVLSPQKHRTSGKSTLLMQRFQLETVPRRTGKWDLCSSPPLGGQSLAGREDGVALPSPGSGGARDRRRFAGA
ncbi:hypothetical protein MC885_001535 [Smutsia gigantea]|nr:hypothetical protein MC885_001535 [Smutsia gigantea]